MVSKKLGSLCVAIALALAVVVAVEIMLLTSPIRNNPAIPTPVQTSEVPATQLPAEETPEPAPETVHATVMYTLTQVNMRTGPSVNDDVYRIVDAYHELTVVGEENGWSFVAENGKVYYVASVYLREKTGGPLVVIDPGHQMYGDNAPEAIGPGAEETKPSVSSGTRGTESGINEFELNLRAALMLQDELVARGYDVIMTRTENDVNISNSERAALANSVGADAFVRIHANGSENPQDKGALTICMTPDNPYNGRLYEKSRKLSDSILNSMCAAAGCNKLYVMETDTMSGINWSEVPVTIVEMGFMTNPEEDALLNNDSYLEKLVGGISDGIDSYFGR